MTVQVPRSVLERLGERGQEGVLALARRAGVACAERLAAELQALDWELLDRQRAALRAGPPPLPQGRLECPELLPPSTAVGPETEAAAAAGWQALRGGRVALCTVAGGQASRLGFEGPKGAFPLGPVTGASLFQILSGMVARLRERAAAPLLWIVQTGPDNDAETRRFFARRSHFGLPPDSVRFMCQGTLPALTPDGDLLLAAPDALFRSPDGHGGFFAALRRSGLLVELRSRGVDTLYYCQVDNALVRLGDPVFLGHHLRAGADMSLKAVAKTDPSERVGVVVRCGDRHFCVEYSDLPRELADACDPDGGLRLRAGNVAMHAFALEFAAAMGVEPLPLHLARKRVRALQQGGGLGIRDAVKFETFVFDALPRARRVAVQLAERGEEFAPLKNREGLDSIATARQALDRRARRWVAEALPGAAVAPAGLLELAPGLALDAADLRQRAAEVELACGGRLLRLRRR